MSPVGWILSALPPGDGCTLPELLSRVPSTITQAEAVAALAGLVADGRAAQGERDGVATYSRRVAP